MNQEVSSRSILTPAAAAPLGTRRAAARQAVAVRAGIGAFLGLAWGTGLRAWMVLLALHFGEQPNFTWKGTFGGVLLPVMLSGALLGGAAQASEFSSGKRWRWVILSPLLLIMGPVIFTENFFTILFTTGMGGGAIGVALIGLLGGYAFSGMGASWKRWISGALAVLLTFASGIGFLFVNSSKTTSPTAGKAFTGLFFVLLMFLLVAGVSAPFRHRSRHSG